MIVARHTKRIEVATTLEDANLNDIFSDWLLLQLQRAYYDARKHGKRKTHDEQDFEINEDENLKRLCDDIISHKYRPSRGTVHIIYKPVMREIFAAPFRDRIVHHLIYNLVYDWWDSQFIYDSYSCREEKGTLLGIRRLDHHIRSASGNYAEEVYIYKLDIQGFFMSIPRERLLKMALAGLQKQYKDHLDSPVYKMLAFLWQQIIMDDPVYGVKIVGKKSDWIKLPPEKSLFNQPPGIGIVIGNLTSQLLSNIFLNALDRFIKYQLGYKHYGRYVDDFYIVATRDQLPQLENDIQAIDGFLSGLGVKLHPKKRKIYSSSQGVPFLGVVVHKGYILPGERVRKNLRQACKDVEMGTKDITTLVSYLGHVKHYDHFKMVNDAFKKVAWNYRY